MKWKQKSDDTACEHVIDIAKEGPKEQTGTYSHRQCTHCLSSHPTIARSHTDATCYFLHPELRLEREEKGDTPIEKAREREETKTYKKQR